jgi:hypothetical protein
VEVAIPIKIFCTIVPTPPNEDERGEPLGSCCNIAITLIEVEVPVLVGKRLPYGTMILLPASCGVSTADCFSGNCA